MRSKVKILLSLLFFVLVSYAIQLLVYQFTSLGKKAAGFLFTVDQVYLFFGCSSAVILIVLLAIPRRFLDNFGFIFIGLTLIKMAFAYGFFYVILSSSAAVDVLEKRQVFVVFAWFLAIETYLSSRILNNSQ